MPAQRLFELLTDHSRYPRWFDFVKEVTYESDERRTGIGATSHWITQVAGIRGELDVEYAEWVPNKHVTVENAGKLFRNSGGGFRLTEETGGTRVDFEIHFDVPLSVLGQVLDRLVISRKLEHDFEIGFKRMQQALDATSARRISTGVVGLDDLLEGGIPRGSMILVRGPPGAGKTTLSRQFLYTTAHDLLNSILLSTAEPHGAIRDAMISFGWNVRDIDRIRFIDCYSWRLGAPSVDIRALTDLSIYLEKFFDRERIDSENDPCLVLDSFTDVLLNNGSDRGIKFLTQLKEKLKNRGATSLVLLEEGIHPENTMTAIEYLTDGTIRTKFDENGRYLMVSRMQTTPVRLGWSEFTIKKGIELRVKDFFGNGG